jgi:hypothetical protein
MALNRLLEPDEVILVGIFPDMVDSKSTSYQVISNTFDTCTFRLQFHISPPTGYPREIIVRMEISKGRLDAVMALQWLAYFQLPTLIPRVLGIGRMDTGDGRLIEYCITAYCSETVPVATVWDSLDKDHRLYLMDSVVGAVRKLQNLDLNTMHRTLTETPFISQCHASPPLQVLIGGPSVGYFQTIKEFLKGLQKTSRQVSPTSRLQEDNRGITIESFYQDIGGVNLSPMDLTELQNHVVFCHNDLEPRNILVTRMTSSDNSRIQYKLAAIIDWELSGFYPFAYEYACKDNAIGMLCSSNAQPVYYLQIRVTPN